jgi:hypothetical protein
MKSPLFISLALGLLMVPPAGAWNATGHRIIAAIAYDRLTPAVRARVDDLIRRHPDYGTLLTQDAPTEPRARARAAFEAAAVWPDLMRRDERFFDETRADVRPTRSLAGFPNMGRHTIWHYIDIPYAPDGAPVQNQNPPNALTEIQRLLAEIGREQGSAIGPYDLPWIEHLAGDVHQPLHCVSRFLRSQPQGDAGGNRVIVAPNRTLHALWDDAAGQDVTDAYVNRYAAEVTAQYPLPERISTSPQEWVDEGFALAKQEVYTFGLETGSSDRPLALPAAYEENARRIARQRIAIAGYRLAAVLNGALGQ